MEHNEIKKNIQDFLPLECEKVPKRIRHSLANPSGRGSSSYNIPEL